MITNVIARLDRTADLGSFSMGAPSRGFGVHFDEVATSSAASITLAGAPWPFRRVSLTSPGVATSRLGAPTVFLLVGGTDGTRESVVVRAGAAS